MQRNRLDYELLAVMRILDALAKMLMQQGFHIQEPTGTNKPSANQVEVGE